MIQEVTHEADEIRRNNTELYDSNRLKQGMGEQARYLTHEQLEDVASMRKEMESLQLRSRFFKRSKRGGGVKKIL